MKREIPLGEWGPFLQGFTRTYADRRALIEVSAPLGEGGPLLEEYEPLRSIELRDGPCGVPEIILTLEDHNGERVRLTHAITDPVRLSVEDEPSGLDIGLQIRSVEGDETFLRFAPAAPFSDRRPIAVGLERSRGRDRPAPERL